MLFPGINSFDVNDEKSKKAIKAAMNRTLVFLSLLRQSNKDRSEEGDNKIMLSQNKDYIKLPSNCMLLKE